MTSYFRPTNEDSPPVYRSAAWGSGVGEPGAYARLGSAVGWAQRLARGISMTDQPAKPENAPEGDEPPKGYEPPSHIPPAPQPGGSPYGGQPFASPAAPGPYGQPVSPYGQPPQGQPAYGQSTSPYGQPTYYGMAAEPKGLSIASLCCGIAVFVGFGFFVLPQVAAVILGHMALRKEPAGKGMAIAGLVMGYLGVVLVIVFWIFIAIIATTAAHNNYTY